MRKGDCMQLEIVVQINCANIVISVDNIACWALGLAISL